MKLEQTADKGDNLETLKALRQKLAGAIDKSESGRDIAALSRQLQLVMVQISELEEERKQNEDDPIGEIIKHRPIPPVRSSRGHVVYEIEE